MNIPCRFQSFKCDEYFNSFRSGRYDESAYIWYILKEAELEIDEHRKALIIGRPGVDGISFCYRSEQDGIWAHYPIEEEWLYLCKTLGELEKMWKKGTLIL